MMYFMHIGRDKEPTKNTVNGADGYVGMMKLCGEKNQYAIDDDVPGLQAEDGN